MGFVASTTEFDESPPSVEEIVNFLESNSTQKVLVEEGLFPGQYAMAFADFRDDVQRFCVEGNRIVISGPPDAAPAVFKILEEALMSLGGRDPHNSKNESVSFPVTDADITRINEEYRALISAFAKRLWLWIYGFSISILVVVAGLIYLIVRWLF